MRDVLFKIAAIGWMAATALCIFGSVKVFGPLAIVLLAITAATNSEKGLEPAIIVILSIPTAGAIFFGIQKHEERLEQIAYFAHRQTIGCTEADRWDAIVGTPAEKKRRKPAERDIQRCAAEDDAWTYKFALNKWGWPSAWLE